MSASKIILGVDPGTTIMGFGLIKVVGKKMEFLQLNELQLSKYDNHYKRLKLIFERTIELIDTFHPDHIAIEAPFFGKNVQEAWLSVWLLNIKGISTANSPDLNRPNKSYKQ